MQVTILLIGFGLVEILAVAYFSKPHLVPGIVEKLVIMDTNIKIMNVLKNLSYTLLSILMVLSMFFVFLINESIIASGSYLILLFLTCFSFYFIPYRMLNSEITISKAIDLVSNLIMGISCAYTAVLLFTNSPDIINGGKWFALVGLFFSYYVAYIRKENSRKVFWLHFITASFLSLLLQFVD